MVDIKYYLKKLEEFDRIQIWAGKIQMQAELLRRELGILYTISARGKVIMPVEDEVLNQRIISGFEPLFGPNGTCCIGHKSYSRTGR